TILIRLYRYFETADAPRDIDDLDLVVADKRPQDRHRDSAGNHIDVFDGLRGNLSNAVSCNEHPRLFAARDLLGEPHHVAAIENDARIQRRIDHDVPLYFGEGYKMNLCPH